MTSFREFRGFGKRKLRAQNKEWVCDLNAEMGVSA